MGLPNLSFSKYKGPTFLPSAFPRDPNSLPSKKASAPVAASTPAPAKKSSPFSFSIPASKTTTPSKAPAKKGGKPDFTWGGRPDPTPEIYVEEKPGFFSAGWRFGKKK